MKTSNLQSTSTHAQAIIRGWVDGSALTSGDGGGSDITQLENGSGGDFIAGDVVVVDTDGTITSTTTAQDTRPVGVVLDDIADGEFGPVAFSGPVALVNVTASVTAGRYAETSTTAKKATENTLRRQGSFGIYTSTSATPSAFLFGAGGGSGISGSGGLPWFVVTDYGAVNDTSTDDLSAYLAAIAAFNAAGGGVLYLPAGAGYYLSDALDAITAPGLILGDGVLATTVITDHTTEHLFTSASTTRAPTFRGIRFVNAATTPTAGSAVRVSSGGNSGRITECRFENWWTGIRHEDGAAWWIDHNTMNSIRKYGIHASNVSTPDEGDAAIHDNVIAASTHSPDTAIHFDSSGGPRIHDNKINGSDPATGFNHGIAFAIAGSDQTSILKASGNTIENIRGNGFNITQAGTATFGQISIVDNQVNLIDNNSGKCLSIVAEDAGAIEHVLATKNTWVTNGTARTPVALTNVDNFDIRGNFPCENFVGQQPFTNSGSTNGLVYYPGAQLQKTNITSAVTVTGTSEGAATTVITGASLTCDGVTPLAFTIVAPYLAAPATVGGFLVVILLEDSTVLGQMGMVLNSAAAALRVPYHSPPFHRTPAAGSHTYTVKAFRDTSGVGTATFHAGAGGTGAHVPAFLKINAVLGS